MNNHVPVGQCTLCGRSAQVNVPKLNSDNGQLICDHCGDSMVLNVVLIGIEQFKADDGEYQLCQQRQVYQLNSNIVYLKPDDSVDCAWTDSGRTAFTLHDDEKLLSVIELFDLMDRQCDDDNYRCSSCGKDFTGQPSGYPLFAGVSCPDCWIKHQEHLKEQKRKGQVCTMCRQPYDACCC